MSRCIPKVQYWLAWQAAVLDLLARSSTQFQGHADKGDGMVTVVLAVAAQAPGAQGAAQLAAQLAA
jgi:hypothetical protein